MLVRLAEMMPVWFHYGERQVAVFRTDASALPRASTRCNIGLETIMKFLAFPVTAAGVVPTGAHATVARLRETAQRTADQVVARAHAARCLATAEAYRVGALELDHQAIRAENLLFGQAVETFRAAAAENRLMADALETIEGGR